MTRRRFSLPHDEDPDGEDPAESFWEQRLRDIERTERASSEILEQEQRSEPQRIAGKVGAANGRTKRRGAAGDLSEATWIAIVRAFRSCCAYCGLPVTFPILEHVVPVAQGGATNAFNVVPSCRACNFAKRGRDPLEWLRHDKAALAGFVRRVQEAERVFKWPTT